MKLLGIQHYSIVITDVDKSRHFYREVLGMRELKPPDRFSTATWMECAGTEIHLIPQEDLHEGPSPARSERAVRDGIDTHIAFVVASISDAQTYLAEKGIEVMCGPRPRGDGVEQLYVRDPDGYLIELFEWG